jgi:Peptidase A4 family
VTRLLRGWRGLGALALLGVFLVSGASAAGALNAHSTAAAPQASSELGHGTPVSSTLPHTNPGHFVTPLEPHAQGGSYTAESSNWAGQVASGTTFSMVKAYWVVPTIQPTQNLSASATWIGIDGGPSSPSTIIQTGTAQQTENGRVSYYAWYELYPNAAVAAFAVSPGDDIEAYINQVSGSDWNLLIKDETLGTTASGPLTYTGPALSAEWIEELPTVVNGPQPALANFGSATFVDTSYVAAIPAANVSPVNMVDAQGQTIASTGAISGAAAVGGTFTISYVPLPHGYWLVGSDGGIFTFGTALFYGSTGSLHLQRPVVGIVPTADRGGYWLDASDGGVFSYGDTQFYGSIPGLGLHPAGSGQPNSLNAPIVGMVPSHDDNGYFMVASDGGVFAFGDAHFAGSCPGIGGCAGSAVAVMPDASGNGYWLVTSTGSIYTFGDAPYFGAPNAGTVTSAVATPDGLGYWVLLNSGQVFAYGDAAKLGAPPAGSFNSLDAATAIFATGDGAGYWVSSALGAVYNFGDAPNDGGMTGTQLNGPIIAATGF